MARINLLPWRAELRKEKQKEFLSFIAFAAIFGLLVMYLFHMYMESQISTQLERNKYIKDQTVIVEKKIKEIAILDEKREQLKTRMELIQRLQHSRPEVVHLFDEIPKVVPEGLHLTSIKRNGNLLTITGKAEASTRITSFLRNIDKSKWLGVPDLSDIQADEKSPVPSHDFTVTVKLKSSEIDEDKKKKNKRKGKK